MTRIGFCFIFLFFIAFPWISSCVSVQNEAYVKDGKVYGVTEGQFRGKWWGLYERGISFGDGDFLKEAEADFRGAIKQRDEDQRAARTYGMHFMDYFPHRELGIILYRQNRLKEALEELQTSMSQEESAKAKFYLNKARQAHLNAQAKDTTPPRIQISTPEKDGVTNRLAVTVSGEASGNNYISGIFINGAPEFIELSEKTIRFERKINLLPGINKITVEAQDLLGNTAAESFKVQADYQGPSLSVMNFANNDQVNTRDILVTVSYADESGMDYVSVAGEKVLPGDQKKGTLTSKLQLKEGINQIRLEAADTAGNKTSLSIAIAYQPGKLTALNTVSGFPGLAPVATDAYYIANKTDASASPPEISFSGLLKALSENQPATITGRKNNNQIFIEGNASNAVGIEEILINGNQVPISKGKTTSFNKLVEFKEGENQFEIIAKNTKGNTAKKSIKVNRRISQVDLDDSKMTLSIMPFKTTSVSKEVVDSVYNLFLQELMNSGRFKLIERGPAFETVLKELKLSQTDLVDKDKAVKAGKLLSSEAILIGDIVEKEKEIEIYAKLINVETSEYLTIQDVYGQEKSRNKIEYLMSGLASKIVFSIPLIEGKVIAVKGSEYYLDLGSAVYFNLKNGIRCLAYRSAPLVVNGVNLGYETTVLGTLVINQVNPKFSSAGLLGSDGKTKGPEINKDDNVITK